MWGGCRGGRASRGFPSPTHVRFLSVEGKTGLDLTQTDGRRGSTEKLRGGGRRRPLWREREGRVLGGGGLGGFGGFFNGNAGNVRRLSPEGSGARCRPGTGRIRALLERRQSVNPNLGIFFFCFPFLKALHLEGSQR